MRERNEICTLYQRIYENQTEVGKKYYCYLQLNVMAIMRIKLHFKNKIQSMYVLFLFLPKLLSKSFPKTRHRYRKRSETVFPMAILYNKF